VASPSPSNGLTTPSETQPLLEAFVVNDATFFQIKSGAEKADTKRLTVHALLVSF